MRTLALILIAVFPLRVLAEENSTDLLPQAMNVVPQEAGAIAPFSGLLVPEARFTELLRAEIEAANLRLKNHTLERFNASLEELYASQLEKLADAPVWYEKPNLNRWLGFAIGVVVTLAVSWGSFEIVKIITSNSGLKLKGS